MKPVVVTLTDDGLKHIDQVAQKLKDRGLQIKNIMNRLGVISGFISSTSSILNIEGVQSVDEDSLHQLPPSWSKLQ